MKPENTAPIKEMIIHVMPIRRADFASRGLRSAMKRTMMCGWPK
jgi:hypothetical protein